MGMSFERNRTRKIKAGKMHDRACFIPKTKNSLMNFTVEECVLEATNGAGVIDGMRIVVVAYTLLKVF